MDHGPVATGRPALSWLLLREASAAKPVKTPVDGGLRCVDARRNELGLRRGLIQEPEQERHAHGVESVQDTCSPVVHLLCKIRIVTPKGTILATGALLRYMDAPRLFEMEASLAPLLAPTSTSDHEAHRRSLEARLALYPRIRFMGSKYRLAGQLAEVFDALPPGPALDAFSGSGIVAYTLKATGRPVIANDHLAFARALTAALVENETVRLTSAEVEELCSGNQDGRQFIAETFNGLYFPPIDHAFLDAAWSHIDRLDGAKRALAISGLCLAAAWKQPRGVFTITTPRYDDGRRQMRMSLESLFREAVANFNDAVFKSAGDSSRSVCSDVFDVDPTGIAVAYLDPPYAPPRDDTCYIKRYHFLEGLATYWRGQEIMWETKTRKLRKRHTPFAYKRTVRPSLDRLFDHFRDSALVVSYGSNAALGVEELEGLLRRHKRFVRRIEIPHRYAFGTHASASRREAMEYVLIGT